MNDLFGHPADEGGGFAPHYCPRCGQWHHADEACAPGPPDSGPILPDLGPPEPDEEWDPGDEPLWDTEADFYLYYWWRSPN